MKHFKDIPQHETVYIDRVLQLAREDGVVGNELLLDSIDRIHKHRDKEKERNELNQED